jgi:hypothetical protein
VNCEELQAQLGAYIEQSLDAVTTEAVDDHLASCPQCRAARDNLAECIRQVAALPNVDPPGRFSQRVMARVRALEGKPALWERLTFPLRIKLPIQVTAAVLISMLAVYLLRKQPEHQPAQPTTETNLHGLERNEEAATATPDIGSYAAAPKKEQAEGEEMFYYGDPAQDPQSQSKTTTRLAPPQGAAEPGIALQDRRVLDKNKERSLESTVPSPAAPAGMTEASSRSGATEVHADVELVVRRGRPSVGQSRDAISAFGKSAETETGARQAPREDRAPLLPKIAASADPQAISLTIPRARYDQLKKELLALGSIESESSRPSHEKGASFHADDLMQINITVLPAAPEKRDPAVPSDR